MLQEKLVLFTYPVDNFVDKPLKQAEKAQEIWHCYILVKK